MVRHILHVIDIMLLLSFVISQSVNFFILEFAWENRISAFTSIYVHIVLKEAAIIPRWNTNFFFFFPAKNGNAIVEEENEAISELGKPRLGDSTKMAVHIIESYEFKV